MDTLKILNVFLVIFYLFVDFRLIGPLRNHLINSKVIFFNYILIALTGFTGV